MLGFGVGEWPKASPYVFDWKPLLLVLVSLLLLRFLVRLAITWPTSLAAIGVGTLWGMLIDWWGILPPTALVVLALLVASWTADRIRNTEA
jgi:hypothetical protein